MNDGGFAVLVPYHSAHQGWLREYLLEPKLAYARNRLIPFDKAIHYTASERVKLSYHADGFVQFSSETAGSIVSGRDPNTGEPKGLGLFTQPLSRPIETGPSFGLTLWGIKDFERFTKPKKREKLIKFSEQNYYYRHASETDWNGYVLEGFVMKAENWKYVRQIHDRFVCKAACNYYELPGTVFKFEVVPHRTKDYFLALLVSRIKTSMGDTGSGFCLSSPSQFLPPGRQPPELVKSINASYPLPNLTNVNFSGTLDYKG